MMLQRGELSRWKDVTEQLVMALPEWISIGDFIAATRRNNGVLLKSSWYFRLGPS